MALSTIKCCGLTVKALDCHAKGPWFKSHQGHKNSFLLQKLYNFFTFFKNLIFVKKTTASQTNFDFTNMGSEMLRFRLTAI